MEQGLLHIYCGDGKGKTTASLGLALRAAGSGLQVVYVQFLKDGRSSEFQILGRLENVTLLPPEKTFGFFWNMGEAERREAIAFYTEHFRRAAELAVEADLLVLDEVIGACGRGAVPEGELLAFLKHRPAGLEVVMTGRNPSDTLLAIADYVTEMRKIKHPFDQKIRARRGIEF